MKRFVDIHVHELGKRISAPGLVCAFDELRLLGVARSSAVRARNINVGKKLHVQTHHARAVAGGTAQTAGVVGKIAALPAARPGVCRPGKDFAEFVVDISVSCSSRANIGADGRGVNELRAGDAGRFCGTDMGGERSACGCRLKRRDEAFEHQRGFSRSRYAGYHREPPLGEIDFEGLYSVDRERRKMNAPEGKHFILSGA